MKASQCHQISVGVIPLGFPDAPLAVGINFSSQRKLGNLKGFFAQKRSKMNDESLPMPPNFFWCDSAGIPRCAFGCRDKLLIPAEARQLEGLFCKKRGLK